MSDERMKDLNEAFNEVQYTILALPGNSFSHRCIAFQRPCILHGTSRDV